MLLMVIELVTELVILNICYKNKLMAKKVIKSTKKIII